MARLVRNIARPCTRVANLDSFFHVVFDRQYEVVVAWMYLAAAGLYGLENHSKSSTRSQGRIQYGIKWRPVMYPMARLARIDRRG